ncbi:MAG TPA: tRNA (guanosine(46)-N7)-methyltransferase TrmB [Bacteroidia bacterium]|nr:tRNA (guanosine(46)-N7)-methyltransferase TrmB [Bacteroidia bacterium]
MGKNKLKRFEEIKTFEKVFQPKVDFHSPDHELKGKWNEKIFLNDHPIVLELGCGRGEYTIGMAKEYPEKNFIGIDIKGARLWRGAKTAHLENFTNAAFLRIRIELIEKFFAENEVSEIWLTFPDPQLRESKENKRLSSPHFLEKYKRMFGKRGLLHLKTDSKTLFEYTLEILKNEKSKILFSTNDLYHSDVKDAILSIQTTYETIFRKAGKNICYLCSEFEK